VNLPTLSTYNQLSGIITHPGSLLDSKKMHCQHAGMTGIMTGCVTVAAVSSAGMASTTWMQLLLLLLLLLSKHKSADDWVHTIHRTSSALVFMLKR
jgi:hypothetical protein